MMSIIPLETTPQMIHFRIFVSYISNVQVPALRPVRYANISKRRKTVQRPYGGSRCGNCVRDRSAYIPCTCQARDCCLLSLNVALVYQNCPCIFGRGSQDCEEGSEEPRSCIEGQEINVFKFCTPHSCSRHRCLALMGCLLCMHTSSNPMPFVLCYLCRHTTCGICFELAPILCAQPLVLLYSGEELSL